MEQENFCKDCHLRDECQEVYRKLGNSDCPPVLYKSIVAFLLPAVVFIVSLAVIEKKIAGGNFFHFSQKMCTAVGFFAALLITVLCMLLLKLSNRLFRNFLEFLK